MFTHRPYWHLSLLSVKPRLIIFTAIWGRYFDTKALDEFIPMWMGHLWHVNMNGNSLFFPPSYLTPNLQHQQRQQQQQRRKLCNVIELKLTPESVDSEIIKDIQRVTWGNYEWNEVAPLAIFAIRVRETPVAVLEAAVPFFEHRTRQQ